MYDNNEKIICDLGPYLIQSQPVIFRDKNEVKANAKLICNAPDILKSLITMTSLCKFGGLDENVYNEILKSEEIIKKVTI